MRGNRTESLREQNLPTTAVSQSTSENIREALMCDLILITSVSLRGVSEILSETLLEEDFPLGDSRSGCPSSCCPFVFLNLMSRAENCSDTIFAFASRLSPALAMGQHKESLFLWQGHCGERIPTRVLRAETGRMRFREVRFQTPNSVSFLGSLSSGERTQ